MLEAFVEAFLKHFVRSVRKCGDLVGFIHGVGIGAVSIHLLCCAP
jgi:hypothetical protein